jgi:hypothetical protein
MTTTEKLGVFGALLVFLVPNVINIWGNLIQQRQARALEKPDGQRTEMQTTSTLPFAKSRPYLPSVASALFLLLTLITVGFNYYDRHYGITPMVFKAWSSNQPGACFATIDGNQLTPWEADGRILLICGIADPTKDAFEDRATQ